MRKKQIKKVKKNLQIEDVYAIYYLNENCYIKNNSFNGKYKVIYFLHR